MTMTLPFSASASPIVSQALLHRVVDEAAGVDDRPGRRRRRSWRSRSPRRAAGSGSVRSRSAPWGSRARRSRSSARLAGGGGRRRRTSFDHPRDFRRCVPRPGRRCRKAPLSACGGVNPGRLGEQRSGLLGHLLLHLHEHVLATARGSCPSGSASSAPGRSGTAPTSRASAPSASYRPFACSASRAWMSVKVCRFFSR